MLGYASLCQAKLEAPLVRIAADTALTDPMLRPAVDAVLFAFKQFLHEQSLL